MNESFNPANGPKSHASQPEELVGKIITFSDPDLNKNTNVKIEKVNRILGKGTFADWVADIDIEVENEDAANSKIRKMALKKYKEADRVEEFLQRSYKNFKILKDLGIPTWNTYRLNIKERLALMTLGCNEDELLFTTNDVNGPKAEAFIKNPIKIIENLNEFIIQLRDILNTLNKNLVTLNGDSWGFILAKGEKENSYRLKPLAADIDFVNSHKQDEAVQIPGLNLHNLIIAIHFMYPGTKQEKDNFVDYIANQLEDTISVD